VPTIFDNMVAQLAPQQQICEMMTALGEFF
jgi:hypothetical protein